MISVLKFLFRVLGYGLLALAIIAGISDASISIAQSQVHLVPLGQVWFDLSPETLNLSQAVVQRYVHPALWDPVLQTLLAWPVWAVLGPFGLLFLFLGARRRRQQVLYA
ncbi:hypothetical protein [Roseibium sp.]|uniref:hypothetical protein n=1 Tax=Roseibium sp. TaxID=1936156 RepID=UPI003D13FA7E